MALKEWRETRQDGWTNDRTLHKIRVQYEDGGIYSFDLYDKSWRLIKIKNFPSHKGQSEAIKYAKSYMRSH
jgi:predicted RecB family nuclease